MNDPAIEVIKLGGSVLDSDDFPAEFQRWFQNSTSVSQPRVRLIVAGGGQLVDAIRDFDSRFGLDSETAHWAAIAMMDHHADLCSCCLKARVLDASEIVSTIGNNQDSAPTPGKKRLPEQSNSPPLFGQMLNEPIFVRVSDWLRAADRTICLPHGWEVTSDAIAAAFAVTLQADQLTLLKSCHHGGEDNVQKWSDAMLVDPVFPRFASQIRTVNWVCLKNDKNPATEGRLRG